MKRWNRLQWLLFCIIVAVILATVIANWAYPQGATIEDKSGFYIDPRLPNPSNPEWVNFVQYEISSFLTFTICLGLGVWIHKISNKRHDKLLMDSFYTIASCKNDADYVYWYFEWRNNGLSDNALLSNFAGKPVPEAIKMVLAKQGKGIVAGTSEDF